MISKRCCSSSWLAHILIIIGGLDLGLIGLGGLFGSNNWNVINFIFKSMPVVENILYLLIGLAVVWAIFGCNHKCSKCCDCSSCRVPDSK